MACERGTGALSQHELDECPIAKLADEDLAKIFKCLPPFERLIMAEICIIWRCISLTPWRDIIHVDLSHVPTSNIHAVIKKCPNLISVSELRQHLGDLGRFASRTSHLTALKCVECTFSSDPNVTREEASVHRTTWEELIWHDSKIIVTEPDRSTAREYPLLYRNPPAVSSARQHPQALRRLQISAVNLGVTDLRDVIFDAFERLPQLESCIMADESCLTGDCCTKFMLNELECSPLTMLANLRELYMDAPHNSFFRRLVSELPRLEILYLNNVEFKWTGLDRLITQHRRLRVLMIIASLAKDSIGGDVITARKLFPKGFNAPPVPQLHLFLGKIAAEKLRFHPSPSDALKIYPIDAPLPEFLEKEEIKAIFEGSWIASRIKEGAKEGVNLADFSFEGNGQSISYVQEG